MILTTRNHIRCLCSARKPETVVPLQARAGPRKRFLMACGPPLATQQMRCDDVHIILRGSYGLDFATKLVNVSTLPFQSRLL